MWTKIGTRSLLVVWFLLGRIAPVAAGIEIDLAVTNGDWTAWGANASDGAGGVQLADFNGDGIPDVAVSASLWDDGATSDVGRVSVFFGPLVFPTEKDLLTEVPDVEVIGDQMGWSCSLYMDAAIDLDVDGDGIADLVVACASAGPLGDRPQAGSVAVFRGGATLRGRLRIADADWLFHGADPSDFLVTARIGDVNGDAAPDLVLFSIVADGPGNTRASAGEAYVYFGPASAWPKRVYDLATDPPDVHIFGADAGDQFGYRQQIADVLSDAISDLIVGAVSGDGAGNSRSGAGEVYVIRGRRTWPTVIDLATDATDLVVHGPQVNGYLKSATVLDWDDDGEPDLAITGEFYSVATPARAAAGAIFVLRGRTQLTGIWDLATRPADATIVGPHASSGMGYLLANGDVNGDGYPDLVATAILDQTPYFPTRNNAGSVLVISGCNAFKPWRDLALEPPELAIYGAATFDHWGAGIGVADLNDDGRADLLSAVQLGDGVMDARRDSGENHVILGRPFAGPVPADLGNSLRAVRLASSVVLTWAIDPIARQYTVHRVERKDAFPSPTLTTSPVATRSLPDVPGPPDLYFYRAAAASCAGGGPY